METIFFGWLIATTLALGFVGIIWSKNGFLNILIKSIYIVLAIMGAIVIYHHLILKLPV